MIMNEGPNAIHTVGYGFVPFHLGFIGIFFFIIIVIFISRWLFGTNRCGYSTKYYHGYSKRENALKIISERCAKGGISKEDFTQIKNDIQEGSLIFF